MDLSDRWKLVWETAVCDALDILSAYPSGYGLTNIGVAAGPSPFEEFRRFIAWRVEFARAQIALNLLLNRVVNPTSTYRRETIYTFDIGRGQILFPRLISEIAAGKPRGFPVQISQRNLQTPENLLISELLSAIRQFAVAGLSATIGHEERADCQRLFDGSELLESSYPWRDLRSLPRSSLRELALAVRGRAIAGVILPTHEAKLIADLYIEDALRVRPVRVEAAKQFIRVIGSDEGLDKLFELLVMAWLIRAIEQSTLQYEIFPEHVSGKGKPFARVRSGGSELAFYFQTGKYLPSSRYIRRGGRRIGGVPDFTILVSSKGGEKLILLDPKCRSASAETEVIYKMLGYKENFGISPYVGYAILPDLGDGPLRRTWQNENNDFVGFMRISLTDASVKWTGLIARAIRKYLHCLEAIPVINTLPV